MQPDESTGDGSLSVLLGRQPIVDRTGALVAYELLYRHGDINAAVVTDDHAATEQVILNAIAQFGVAGALGSQRGYVNIGRETLGSDSLMLLDPKRFTLEILENVVIDEEVERECVRLRRAGFQLALDDVISVDRVPARILELVDVVKIDLRSVVMEDLPALIRAAHAAGCLVLAEKVETKEEHRQILALGADLFQGYFFARPEILSQSQVSASRTALLKLNNVLARDPSLAALELEVKRNPVLLAQLMKFAGSAGAAGRGDMTVAQAISRVGTRQLARLAQLLLFADGALQLEDDPLLQMVYARARFMERIAAEFRADDDDLADAAFQTGIFSLMHVVTGQTSQQLLGQVGTSERIKAAILYFEGELGDLLTVAELMEGFHAEESARALARCGIGMGRLTALFAESAGESLSG
jgi:EAL and modified HD-GYP domain-containing signal transduction protein